MNHVDRLLPTLSQSDEKTTIVETGCHQRRHHQSTRRGGVEMMRQPTQHQPISRNVGRGGSGSGSIPSRQRHAAATAAAARTLATSMPLCVVLLLSMVSVNVATAASTSTRWTRISIFPTVSAARRSSSSGGGSICKSSDSILVANKGDTRAKRQSIATGNRRMTQGTKKQKSLTVRQMETLKLLSGGVAGTIASSLTNPLEVVKTQLQQSKSSSAAVADGAGRALSRLGAYQIAKNIWQRDGLSGFFRGLPPTLIGIVPSRSVYFYAYQRCQSWLEYINFGKAGSPSNALVAGLLAGMTSNTITNPIWMIRTRMQLNVDAAAGQVLYRNYGDVIVRIFKEQGVAGFYKGLTASYWGCTEGAIQFLLYEQFKTRLLQRANDRNIAVHGPNAQPITELPKATYFWSAAAAKMVASMLTYPHEVARTRMREQARLGVFKYKGMWQTMSVILREEGYRKGLYSGMGIHLIKVVPNSALMFLTYEVVRGWLSGFAIADTIASTKPMTPKSIQTKQKQVVMASVVTNTKALSAQTETRL